MLEFKSRNCSSGWAQGCGAASEMSIGLDLDWTGTGQ